MASDRHGVLSEASEIAHSLSKLTLDLHDRFNGATRDFHSQNGYHWRNLSVIRRLIETRALGRPIKDRDYLNEEFIQWAASLPNNSRVRNALSGTFVRELWNGLQHPPLSYVADEFRFRSADGSNNNILAPKFGAAGSSYARSVKPEHVSTVTLPDPDLVFETLMKRDGPAREHPTKVSSLLFHFATIIIHDIFDSDKEDVGRSKTSSYLDLGPLYGHNLGQQYRVRTFEDGRIKPDTFADDRVLGQAPGVCALLVAFNRYHNWVVGELATNNEDERFSIRRDLPYDKAVKEREDHLFETGRLITCGLYVNIILGDYLRTILNLNGNPVNSNWTLDPREAFQDTHMFNPEGIPKGMGNQVSAEFNFVYRWHCATSNRDQKWMEGFVQNKILKSDEVKDWSQVNPFDLLQKLKLWREEIRKPDPETWTFADAEGRDIPRKEDKSLPDEPLIELLYRGTESVAGAFGARNVPAVMKVVETLGIRQGRQWGMATFNEFRKFFKLKEFTTFKEINSQPGVAEALEALYGHPDNVELYVGLMVEEAKLPLAPGSGLCPGFTISEAILADAVALVRGDRFYSVEWGPQSLTKWGFAEVKVDDNVAGGAALYKLLMRAFPQWYTPESVYALYPFSTPDRTRQMFQKGTPNNIELNYARPKRSHIPKAVCSWHGIRNVLSDQQRFKVPWGLHTMQMIGRDYMLSGDSLENAKQRCKLERAMYDPTSTLEDVRKFYEAATKKLIASNRRKLGQGFQIDVVKDIGNLAHTMFAAKYFGIPLRDPTRGSGPKYNAEQLYDVLADVFEYVFLDLDLTTSYKNRVKASGQAQALGAEIRAALNAIKNPGWFPHLRNLLDWALSDGLPGFGKNLGARLIERGTDVEQAVWEVVPTAAAAAATQAQAWAQMIEVYFRDENKEHWEEIERLAKSDSSDSFEKLRKYVLEGFRLSPAASGVIRVAAAPATIPYGEEHGQSRTVDVQPGDQLFLSFIEAGRDPARFPEPDKIKLDRREEDYIHHGFGPHTCLGQKMVPVAAAAMLRAFARECSNPRRAPGPAGKLKSRMKKIATPANDPQNLENWKGFPQFMAEDGSVWKGFPATMKLMYDEPIQLICNKGERVVVKKHGKGTLNGHMNGYVNAYINEYEGGAVKAIPGKQVDGPVDGFPVGFGNEYENGNENGNENGYQNGHENGY